MNAEHMDPNEATIKQFINSNKCLYIRSDGHRGFGV